MVIHRTFEVCMQVLASQLLLLANRNVGQAIPPLFWPVNCIKIGGHVALLSDPTVNCLYCGVTIATLMRTRCTTELLPNDPSDYLLFCGNTKKPQKNCNLNTAKTNIKPQLYSFVKASSTGDFCCKLRCDFLLFKDVQEWFSSKSCWWLITAKRFVTNPLVYII